MNKIDYGKLEEITVRSQDELDAMPDDFAGRIYIEFGTTWNKAVVSKKYRNSVVARENSSVVARGNSSVVARENSSVVAQENSSVEAWGNSSVVAWGNSSVVAQENSSVVGNANAQVVDMLLGGRIEITGNARIVYMPKTIEEYCSFYGIKHNKKTGKFFKCVHKREDGVYFSDYETEFAYAIGKKVTADCLDEDPAEDCGHGIHISYLAWVLAYGNDWDDLAILEVEAALDGIVLPDGCPGKARCAEVTVLREVPLEECGIYGQILAKRRIADKP